MRMNFSGNKLSVWLHSKLLVRRSKGLADYAQFFLLCYASNAPKFHNYNDYAKLMLWLL